MSDEKTPIPPANLALALFASAWPHPLDGVDVHVYADGIIEGQEPTYSVWLSSYNADRSERVQQVVPFTASEVEPDAFAADIAAEQAIPRGDTPADGGGIIGVDNPSGGIVGVDPGGLVDAGDVKAPPLDRIAGHADEWARQIASSLDDIGTP